LGPVQLNPLQQIASTWNLDVSFAGNARVQHINWHLARLDPCGCHLGTILPTLRILFKFVVAMLKIVYILFLT
jgi:hypothetical protein